jgi:predicted phage tail protein
MSEGLVTVRLWGTLGQQFGHEHQFALNSPVEAFSALDANFPGFRREMIKFRSYYVVADGEYCDNDSAFFPVSREIDICPEVEGQAFIVPLGVAAFGAIGITGTLATVLTYVVIIALMIGVSLLLAPKPKKNSKEDKKNESNAFSGPDNIVGQGAAVPIIYGRVFVGSVVVAIGIETSDQIIQ